jgi:FtsH-binding integral membrane protein
MTNANVRVPGSLAEVTELAPMVMAATGLITMAEGLFLSRNGLALVLGGFAIPTAGTTLTALYLSRRQWGRAVGAVAAWFAAHAVVAFVAGFVMEGGSRGATMAVFAAAVVSGVTVALASPVLVAAAVYGRRRDLEAGDAYLGVAGLWFLVVELLGAQSLSPSLTDAASWLVTVPGMLASLAAIGVAVGRIVKRRVFTRRVARGALSGWRVRSMSPGDDVAVLPPLFGSSVRATAVLERVEAGFTAYRSALVGMPVARVGGAAARALGSPVAYDP